MPARTSMIHVRVDDELKARATNALAGVGLTLSDAARILLTRVAAERRHAGRSHRGPGRL